MNLWSVECVFVELKELTADVLVFNFILYGCLPLWLIMGFADWYCHKKSQIERTTGIKESIFHAIMGIQIGIPVFLGLYFQINVLLLLIMFAVLIFHEIVAHMDVKYALNTREITIFETHVHSFMEVLPFVIVALIVCINWSAFVDLITFNWAGNMGLAWKPLPLDAKYVTGYFVTLLVLDVIPFIEELARCYLYQKRKPPDRQPS
jgi:hypothetical protein